MTAVPGLAILRLAEALHEADPHLRMGLRELYKVSERVIDGLLDDPEARAMLAAEIERREPAHTSS